MAQEREIATRLVSLGDLLEVVAAIRAIAASQMQQALRSLDAIRCYSDTIREALADAVRMLPSDKTGAPSAGGSASGLILFCGEHGLCGGFNERLVRIAEQVRADRSHKFVLVAVGSRGGQICRERNLEPDLVLPMATHCAGVTATARRLATEVYTMLNNGRLRELEAVYAQHAKSETMRIERHRLLPLELSAMKRESDKLPPLINLNPRQLFDEIVAEYFFAALENAAMQSFYSENASRFRTMEAAHQNIETRTEDLTQVARRLRQEAVTTEILDLISGTQALSGA